MLVLAMFVAIGVFFVAFLLRFTFALHSEARIERARDARTKQIASRRIPIAVEVRKPALTVTWTNPGIVHPSEPETGLSRTPMRRALATLTNATVGESSRNKRQA